METNRGDAMSNLREHASDSEDDSKGGKDSPITPLDALIMEKFIKVLLFLIWFGNSSESQK